jgi:hypothetical protein
MNQQGGGEGGTIYFFVAANLIGREDVIDGG